MRAEDDFERRPRKPGRFRLFGGRRKGSASPQEQPGRGVATPREAGKRMEEFARTRSGVEAYLEPPTLDQSPSVVLVAADGEWQRFTPVDEGFARKFSERHGMPAYDVARVGYPKRMREYRRRREEPQD